MEPSLLFFQVTAAVLPTLTVAIVVSGNTFDLKAAAESDKEDIETGRFPMAERAVLVAGLVYFGFFIVGERAALTALYYNEPTELRAQVVLVALVVSVFVLVLKLVFPAMVKDDEIDRGTTAVVLLSILIVAALSINLDF
jgi:uncharacterized membrane protein